MPIALSAMPRSTKRTTKGTHVASVSTIESFIFVTFSVVASAAAVDIRLSMPIASTHVVISRVFRRVEAMGFLSKPHVAAGLLKVSPASVAYSVVTSSALARALPRPRDREENEAASGERGHD